MSQTWEWVMALLGLVARMPQGTPPVDYTPMTQADLLEQFSDAIGKKGITPRSLRNLVGSTVTTTPGGVPPTIPIPLPGWTTATRPTGMVGPALGYNYDLRQLDMWDDHTNSWVNPAFSGGTVSGATTFAAGVTFSSTAQVAGTLTANGDIVAPNLPTSCSGKVTGTLNKNGNVVGVCP